MGEFVKRPAAGNHNEPENPHPPSKKTDRQFPHDQVRDALVDVTGIEQDIELVTPESPFWQVGVQELKNRHYLKETPPDELRRYFLTTFANSYRYQPIIPPLDDINYPEEVISRLVKKTTDSNTQKKVRHAITEAIDDFDIPRDPPRFLPLVLLASRRRLNIIESAIPLIKKVDNRLTATNDNDMHIKEIKAYKQVIDHCINAVAGFSDKSQPAFSAVNRWFYDDTFDPSLSPVLVSALIKSHPDDYPIYLKRMYERMDTIKEQGPDVPILTPAKHAHILGAGKTAGLLDEMDAPTLRRFLRDLSAGVRKYSRYNLGIGKYSIVDTENNETYPAVANATKHPDKIRDAFDNLPPN